MLLRKYFGLKLCPTCYHIQNMKNVGQLGECEVRMELSLQLVVQH